MLSATEGVFVTLAEDNQLPWSWEPVKERLEEIVRDKDVTEFVNSYSHTSKINADHSKKITKNKSYEAPWTARSCALIKQRKT